MTLGDSLRGPVERSTGRSLQAIYVFISKDALPARFLENLQSSSATHMAYRELVALIRG